MRYARMIRPRRRPSTFNKLGHTFALHLRHSKISSLIALLIIFPFFVATILSILHQQDSLEYDGPLPPSLQNTTEDPFNLTDIHPNRINITIPQFLRQHATRRTSTSTPDQTISLIAACMNAPESLSLALPSWEAIQQLYEIILVDWSSTTSIYDVPRLPNMIATGRLSLIRVVNADSWVLSRAYNLASKFATGKYILKVDCDTHLDPSFLIKQPLPPHGKYYTATWGSERDSNEQKLRGVWFGHTTDYRNVGGYDERIVEYGYEDTDLYKRFDASLEAIPLDLDSVRHNIAGDTVWRRESSPSKRISTRMNQAFLSNISSWGDVLAAGNASSYDYSYDNVTHIVYASITRTPVAAQEETSVEQVERMKVQVLQKALHDDFNIPWDVLPSLGLPDLEYLAAYLDSDQADHIIITTLEGRDTLANLFNLVSALQLGITTGRPVIAIWPSPANETVLSQLINIRETNDRLQQVIQSVTARRHGFSKASRLISAEKWKCKEGLSKCAKVYDSAYSEFVEVGLVGNKVYDERDPLPLSIRHHGFLRLGNSTKLGSTETRALAFGCIVFSDMVMGKMKLFNQRIGAVAVSALNYSTLVATVRAEMSEKTMVPVVGLGEVVVRKELFGDVNGFCETNCGIKELGMEMANVVGVVKAENVVPDVGDASRESWEEDSHAIAKMMVADLRILYRQSTLV